MKNILKILILLLLVFAYGCETYEVAEPDFTHSYPAYVELASTSGQTVPEGGNIVINLSSRTVIYEAYTVSYEITGDYTASGTLNVPKGVNSFTEAVPVEAGIVSDEALSATITLTAVTGGLELGRNGANLSVDVTITKFVPFVADDYAITFSCNEPGYGDYPVDFITTDDPHVLTNTNFWDSGWSVDYTFSADFEQLVTIVPQSVEGFTIEGSGTYDGVTKTIIVDYTVVEDATGDVWDNNTHTFTVPS